MTTISTTVEGTVEIVKAFPDANVIESERAAVMDEIFRSDGPLAQTLHGLSSTIKVNFHVPKKYDLYCARIATRLRSLGYTLYAWSNQDHKRPYTGHCSKIWSTSSNGLLYKQYWCECPITDTFLIISIDYSKKQKTKPTHEIPSSCCNIL
jgi:hypothetical protein